VALNRCPIVAAVGDGKITNPVLKISGARTVHHTGRYRGK
jgi:hypothetical protein